MYNYSSIIIIAHISQSEIQLISVALDHLGQPFLRQLGQLGSVLRVSHFSLGTNKLDWGMTSWRWQKHKPQPLSKFRLYHIFFPHTHISQSRSHVQVEVQNIISYLPKSINISRSKNMEQSATSLPLKRHSIC